MNLHRFSDATIVSIKSYVYALADQMDRIFYIGKGKGNRVFDHVGGVRELLVSDPLGLLLVPDQEQDEDPELNGLLSDKRQRIAGLLRQGGCPKMYILREGLDETQALAIESVLISVLDWQLKGGLTNLAAGHGTYQFGLKTVDELEATKGEPFSLSSLPDASKLGGREVIAININRRWPEVERKENPNSLFDVSAGDWRVGFARASKCPYAIVHANGVVRGVFKIDRWTEAQGSPVRYCFAASPFPELDGAAFKNKNASSLFGDAGGSQNPIRYIRMPD